MSTCFMKKLQVQSFEGSYQDSVVRYQERQVQSFEGSYQDKKVQSSKFKVQSSKFKVHGSRFKSKKK